MLKKVFILYVFVVCALYTIQYLGCNKENMSTMRLHSTTNYPYGFATHIPTNYAINSAIKLYRDNYNKSKAIMKQSATAIAQEPEPHNSCTLLPREF